MERKTAQWILSVAQGSPKFLRSFRIHLMYPCWGNHEQLYPSLTEILSSASCLRRPGDEGAAQGVAVKKVKFPCVSELYLYRATEHCNILSVCVHPWYLLVKLMPTHFTLPHAGLTVHVPSPFFMVWHLFLTQLQNLNKSLNCSYKSYARGDQGVSFQYFCVSVLFSKSLWGFSEKPNRINAPKSI